MTTRKTAQQARPQSPASQVVPATMGHGGTAQFPIVGLGASAGGLEAFEAFFHAAPTDSGMGFVLVPHLDPGHASILTEILQRATAMPVVEALDQTPVLPNHVYVVPPNRDMTIFHGMLQLSVPEQPRGQRMPIDAFLRSLAEDQGEYAIGIVLSGTGSDGTEGLRAIVGAGGIALVQAPASAKYEGMPGSAIQAGYATYVLPPEQMPAALAGGKRTLALHHDTPPAPAAQSGINQILMLLRSATGTDFSLYKKSTIRRRIERRMQQHDLDAVPVYARYLKEHPAEIQTLFKELLINVTSFFRDPEAFVVLKQDILPQLLADKPAGYVLRVWVAGCATGEEAYSIAILLRELMEESPQEFKAQIYATDLDDDAIAMARAGTYPASIAQDVSPERLRRFFSREEAAYRVKNEIREMVVFAVQNVIKDPPFTKLDLLACRNLLIYLEPELQERLIPTFHYALKPGGMLFLSPSESIGNHPGLFAAQNRKWKFYRATHSAVSARAVMASSQAWTVDSGKAPEGAPDKAGNVNLADLTRRVLLQSFAPASVVTDLKGGILYVFGDTGNYLRPAPGQASLNAIEMAREGLQLELRTAIQHAASHHTAVVGREAAVKIDGEPRTIGLSVRPLTDTDAGEGLLLVSFQPLPPPARRARGRRAAAGATEVRRIEELEHDLAYTRENLQATIEEQQASNEELKSANEELQSTNEELQSTNEELETSKEEMQSINEELITVNSELQTKIEQLIGLQNDMKNLLDNITVGTIFLDRHLAIRRYTREAAQVYRLVASDVGRPLADIKSDLSDDHLLADAHTVLDTLVPAERRVQTLAGQWFLVRIQPYRTLDNMIDGVVITLSDISAGVAAEAAILAARNFAENIVDTVREPLLVLDADLRVVAASRSFFQRFHVLREDTLGRALFELGNRQWDIPALRERLESVLRDNASFDDYVVERDSPALGSSRMVLNARSVINRPSDPPLILLAIELGG